MPPAESAPGATDVLVVEGVAVRFGGVAALSDANLRVKEGTVTGLIGPNGAEDHPVQRDQRAPDPGPGDRAPADTDITGMKPHRRPSRPGPHLPAARALRHPLGRRERPGRPGVVREVVAAAPHEAVVPLGEAGRAVRGRPCPRASRPVPARWPWPPPTACWTAWAWAASGAEQASAMPTGLARMVELARALAMAPKVLLLDEPGSGLDDAEAQSLGELLTTLAKGGMGVLLVEHDMELVMRICDYIYVLDFGDVIAEGTPEEIRRDPMVQAAYLGAVTETEADAASEAFDAAGGGGAAAGRPGHDGVRGTTASGRDPADDGEAPPGRTAAGAWCRPPPTAPRRPRRPPAGGDGPGTARRLRTDRGPPRGRSRDPGRQRVRPPRPERRRQVDPAQGHERPDAADRR